MEAMLFYVHYALLLAFGVVTSLAFTGQQLGGWGRMLSASALFVLCGGLQILCLQLLGEATVWKCYPLLTHAPIVLYLTVLCRKRLVTALSAVATAYLCCQPAKWVGLLVQALGGDLILQLLVQMLVLLAVGFVSLQYFAPFLSALFRKDTRSICIFGSIPVVYYLFDYVTGIYTSLWEHHSRLIGEFLPFFLCVFYLVFCVVYCKEYERKADAQRQEQLVRISLRQQSARMEAVSQTEKEVRILRHDLRMLLNNILLALEHTDTAAAKEMIVSYVSRIEGTQLQRYCGCDMLNYVLSDCAAKCEHLEIRFQWDISLDQPGVDELLFCSILSNALDNAIHAQQELPKEQRCIQLMLRRADGKLLLSVKNPLKTVPDFADGLPVSPNAGKDHGYGTQSIRYVTEKLGGNCQFSIQNGWFLLRVVL